VPLRSGNFLNFAPVLWPWCTTLCFLRIPNQKLFLS
jgi:hypothetical protein